MADSNQDAHRYHPHPDWYDPGTDFDHPRYAFALRVGSRVAVVSSDDWTRVEAVLAATWVILHEGLTWDEARPAIYHSWWQSKLGR
jgi:hypothetical protein